MAKKQKSHADPVAPEAAPHETITIDKEKAMRLGYRIVTAQRAMLSPIAAKSLVEDTFGIPWEEIKAYIASHPH